MKGKKKKKKKTMKTPQAAAWTASEARIGAACVQHHSNERRGNTYVGAGAPRGHPCKASPAPDDGWPEKETL